MSILRSGGFAATHGNRYGEFRSSADRFSGVLWTPLDGGTDLSAEYSDAICWIGVMWSKIYEIQPDISDVPEFSAGFVVWPFNDNFGDEDRERIRDITARLNDADPNGGPWECWFLPEAVYSCPPYQRVTIRRAQSFWDFVKDQPDWLEVRDSFVSEVMAALERLTPEDVRYLRDWADQERPDGPSDGEAH